MPEVVLPEIRLLASRVSATFREAESRARARPVRRTRDGKISGRSSDISTKQRQNAPPTGRSRARVAPRSLPRGRPGRHCRPSMTWHHPQMVMACVNADTPLRSSPKCDLTVRQDGGAIVSHYFPAQISPEGRGLPFPSCSSALDLNGHHEASPRFQRVLETPPIRGVLTRVPVGCPCLDQRRKPRTDRSAHCVRRGEALDADRPL